MGHYVDPGCGYYLTYILCIKLFGGDDKYDKEKSPIAT